MKNNFIKLTSATNESIYHINSMLICGIIEHKDICTIHTIGGQTYSVTETALEIMKLIKKSETFTLITK